MYQDDRVDRRLIVQFESYKDSVGDKLWKGTCFWQDKKKTIIKNNFILILK